MHVVQLGDDLILVAEGAAVLLVVSPFFGPVAMQVEIDPTRGLWAPMKSFDWSQVTIEQTPISGNYR